MDRRESSDLVPPPLPGQPTVTKQSGSSPPDQGCPPEKKWHWPTVLFAALPATFLSFPAAVAILLGFTFALALNPFAFVMLLCGVLSWVGMISLWSAARSSGVVTKRTAQGMAGGIVGVLLYYGIAIFGEEQGGRLWSWTPLLTIGPLLCAISYLRRYRKIQRQIGAGQNPDSLAIRSPAEARPIDEVKMRKVITLLLIIPALIELATVPYLLKTPLGMGYVAIIILSFPVFLGIAVTSVWCLLRSRALRVLAGATLLTPILLPLLFHRIAKLFGHEVSAQIGFSAAIAIAVLILLVKPKRIADYLPHFAVDSRRFNVGLTWLLAAMLLPWATLAILFRSLRESGSQAAITFLLCYAGISIVVALVSMVLAYIGLRAQQRQQTRLRIMQIGLSVVLLLLGGAVAGMVLFFLSLAGLG